MSSPEPQTIPKPKTKTHKQSSKKDNEKRKLNASKSSIHPPASGSAPVERTEHGKNEGTNTSFAYTPPTGAVLLDHASVDAEEFDWDQLKGNEDHLELWIVRVPEGLKPKQLQNVKLDVPSSSSMTGKIGSIERKHASYDVWSLGEDSPEPLEKDEKKREPNILSVGGEEIKNLSCLVPRSKKGGKLYLAPKLATRHIVITTKSSLPTPDPSSASSSESDSLIYKNPPRPSYPTELLKHRFMPLGSLAPTDDQNLDEQMAVDEVQEQTGLSLEEDKVDTKLGKEKQVNVEKEDGGRKKKRKVDVTSPTASKKSKKAKTTA